MIDDAYLYKKKNERSYSLSKVRLISLPVKYSIGISSNNLRSLKCVAYTNLAKVLNIEEVPNPDKFGFEGFQNLALTYQWSIPDYILDREERRYEWRYIYIYVYTYICINIWLYTYM
jgi:hypothetical protein